MTQTVTVPQSIEELQSAKVKDLRAIVAVIKSEDTDALPTITVKSNKEALLTALTEYMGFTEDVTTDIESAVQNDLIESAQQTGHLEVIHITDNTQDVMDLDFGGDVPSLETTGNEEVDNLLSELGLDDLEATMSPEELAQLEQQAEADNKAMEEAIQSSADEKPKKERAKRATIPMDAPIPVRNYQNLLLGIYGNILDEREEPFPETHKYAGMTHEERKLERFNPKAHEVFRNTKGHMHLVYTNVGASYLIVMKKPDGTLDPVLEVANKGRGHLRCKQIANVLQVAYNEKNDQEVIPAEAYGKLVEQIELLPINLPGTEAPKAEEAQPEVTAEQESQGA